MPKHERTEGDTTVYAWPIPGPHRPLHDRETIIRGWRAPISVAELKALCNA